jgi:hypothetical protein
MATPTQTPRRPRSPKPVRVRTQIRGPQPATTTRTRREQTLADAKARETRARRDLALALVRAEQTYALAARRLEEFDDYLRAVRARLRDAGYLSSARLARGRARFPRAPAASRTPRSLVAPTRPSSSRRAPGPRSGTLLILLRPTGRHRACHRAPGAPEPRARRRQSSRMGSSPTPCDGRSSPSTGIGTGDWSHPANHPTLLRRPHSLKRRPQRRRPTF